MIFFKIIYIYFNLLQFLLCLNIYNSKLSTTFHLLTNQFKLSYLDKTKLKGFICQDIIYFMNSSILTSFGCISSKYQTSFYSNEISGILGLGFPIEKELYSTNLFNIFTFNQRNNSNNNINNYYNQKIFTLILNPFNLTGILQLGGYNLNNIYPMDGLGKLDINHQFTLPVLRDCQTSTNNAGINNCPFRNFRVGISKIRFGIRI